MTCVVLASGDLKLDNELFTSPSGAGHAVRHRATNGWTFWRMPDGRRLKDVRTTFRSAPEAECSEVEWTGPARRDAAAGVVNAGQHSHKRGFVASQLGRAPRAVVRPQLVSTFNASGKARVMSTETKRVARPDVDVARLREEASLPREAGVAHSLLLLAPNQLPETSDAIRHAPLAPGFARTG